MDVFELVLKFVADGDIPIHKYESKKSGLQVVFANVDGPLVHGYISFATEAKSDDGLPHTLEHLVFMGSEDYPWKGVLDLLANACMASGTNAWTDTDHTCYTLSTAGEEGFLNMLPIYLDHLLNPLLTDQAFVTEVHHVNGQGEDGGVVYCEMQGRENTCDSKCHLAMMRQMYPGDNGYKYETGGILKNLRESTTNQKCKAYHSHFYHPRNMCILMVGKIDHENAIQSIAKFESKYLEKRAAKGKSSNEDNFVRPWQTRVPPLTETCKKVIKFPSDTEDNGAVHIGWRGPSAVKNFDDITILGVLMDYLTDTAVSPLQREFVQIADPYCSNVHSSHAENSVSCFYLIFESVPVKKLNSIESKLFEVLQNIIDGKEPINMKRMETVIHRAILNIINSCETSPQHIMASAVIGDFLYGTHVDDLKTRLSIIPLLETLYEKKENFWIKLIEKYFPNAKYVVIIGEPSESLLKEMTESEKKRIEEQRKRLGPEGLKEKEKILSAAKQLKKPPKEILNKFKRPSVEKLNFHKVLRITNYIKPEEGANVSSLFRRLTDVPYRFQVDNLNTNFVTFHVLMNTSTSLQPNARLYLPLWTELVTQTVIEKKGVVIPYENIVTQLAADTISSQAFIGLDSGLFAQMAVLHLKVEVEKFEKGVSWLHDILYNTKFTAERLIVIVKKLLNVIADSKREGYSITSCLSKSLNFSSQCNHWAVNLFRQRAFLRGVEKKLKQSPDAIIKDLEELRQKLTTFENLTIHVAINERKLNAVFSGDPVDSMVEKFVPEKFKNAKIHEGTKFVLCSNLLRNDDKLPNGVITGVGAVESSFLIQTVPSINSFTNADYPAVLTLVNYFSQCEGPLFRDVRGKGLAYGVDIHMSVVEGLMSLVIYKSVKAVEAYEKTAEIISKHISGEIGWNESLLESAKSSLTFALIHKERTVTKVSYESMLAYIKGVDVTYNRKLMKAVWAVTIDDLKKVAPKYLKPLFDPKVAKCVICCHPSHVSQFVDGMKKLGRQLEVIDLEKPNFLDSDLLK